MTPDEIRALDDRALDRVIAEALGALPPGTAFDGGPWTPKRYSTDLNACAEAEEEIEKRGLLGDYADTLIHVRHLHTFRIALMSEAMIATARQRAEALAAVLAEGRTE